MMAAKHGKRLTSLSAKHNCAFMANEADILSDEIKGNLGSNEGVAPKSVRIPIRKRGYHRALKRGEQWALNRKNCKTIDDMFKCYLNEMFQPMYSAMFRDPIILKQEDLK